MKFSYLKFIKNLISYYNVFLYYYLVENHNFYLIKKFMNHLKVLFFILIYFFITSINLVKVYCYFYQIICFNKIN
jgi:hypothetical protein